MVDRVRSAAGKDHPLLLDFPGSAISIEFEGAEGIPETTAARIARACDEAFATCPSVAQSCRVMKARGR